MIQIGNAAGTCKTAQAAHDLDRSDVDRILIGTLTELASEGNSGDGETFVERDDYTLNRIGLANPGIMSLRRITDGLRKPWGVSVFASEQAVWPQLVLAARTCGASFVELNLGCPNVDEGVVSNSYVLRSILASTGLEVGVKLPPILDPDFLLGMVKTLNELQPLYVAACNTLGGIRHNGRRWGLAGKPLLPIALGQVGVLREQLPSWVQVVGVGGISSAHDVEQYRYAGADGVQIGSALLRRGPVIFAEIKAALAERYQAATDRLLYGGTS